MKVLHLISSLDKGGAETQLVELINEQIKKKYEINVCYLKGNSYWVDYLRSKNVTCHFINYKNSLNIIKLIFSVIKIFKIAKIFKPNIIHSHLNLAEVLSFFLSFFFRETKYITTKHLDSFILSSSYSNQINKFYIFFENLILSRAEKIICISKSVHTFFLSNTNINKSKFHLVYYGINSVSYDNVDQQEIDNFYTKFNLSKNTYVIGTIARHVPQKNLSLLLLSYRNFIDKYNIDSKLVIVGDGFLKNKLKQEAEKLNINKSIIWIDFFEKNPILFKVFDVFCLTSNYEGLGLVLLEALCSKTPVVATNISAIPEVIQNNYNGYLFEKNDYLKLSELMLKVYKSENKEIKNNGRNVIEKNFSLKIMSSRISKIYSSENV